MKSGAAISDGPFLLQSSSARMKLLEFEMRLLDNGCYHQHHLDMPQGFANHSNTTGVDVLAHLPYIR
jgi:hypothetical protein